MLCSSFRLLSLDPELETRFSNFPTYEGIDRILKHSWYIIPATLSHPLKNFMVAAFFHNYCDPKSNSKLQKKVNELVKKFEIEKAQVVTMTCKPKIVMASFNLFSEFIKRDVVYSTTSFIWPDEKIANFLDTFYKSNGRLQDRFKNVKDIDIDNAKDFSNIDIPKLFSERLTSTPSLNTQVVVQGLEIKSQPYTYINKTSKAPLAKPSDVTNQKPEVNILAPLINHVWMLDAQQNIFFTYIHNIEFSNLVYGAVIQNLNKRYSSHQPVTICENQLLITSSMFYKILEDEKEKLCIKEVIYESYDFSSLFTQPWYFTPRYDDYIFTKISDETQIVVDNFLGQIDVYLGKIKNVSFKKNNLLFISKALRDELVNRNFFPGLEAINPISYPCTDDFSLPSTILEESKYLKWFQNLKTNEIFFVFPLESIYQPLVYFELTKHPKIKEFLDGKIRQIKRKKNLIILPLKLFEFMKACPEFEFLKSISLIDCYEEFESNELEALFKRTWYVNPKNQKEVATPYSVYDNQNYLNQLLQRIRLRFTQLPEGKLDNKNSSNLLFLPKDLFIEILKILNLPLGQLEPFSEEISNTAKSKHRSLFNRCISHVFETLNQQDWKFDFKLQKFYFICTSEKLGLRLRAFLNTFLKVISEIDATFSKDVASFSSVNKCFHVSHSLMLSLKIKNYLPSCQLNLSPVASIAQNNCENDVPNSPEALEDESGLILEDIPIANFNDPLLSPSSTIDLTNTNMFPYSDNNHQGFLNPSPELSSSPFWDDNSTVEKAVENAFIEPLSSPSTAFFEGQLEGSFISNEAFSFSLDEDPIFEFSEGPPNKRRRLT